MVKNSGDVVIRVCLLCNRRVTQIRVVGRFVSTIYVSFREVGVLALLYCVLHVHRL